MYWIPFLVFLAHVMEEFRWFPAWATRHFGATSNAWYAYSHIVLVAVAASVSGAAQGAAQQSTSVLLAMALMLTLAWNAVFHIVTTVLFREYSPGVLTGGLLILPATWYLVRHGAEGGALTAYQWIASSGIAAVVQAVVIASLFLNMDIDWRFRRRRETSV